jgi:hypothetical protein
MVARIFLLLFLSSGLMSCRSATVAAQAEQVFGPVPILLYAELREATHGWLGDSPASTDIEAVTYSYSANFKELERAIVEIIRANEEGQHKAVKAIVTGQRIKAPGVPAVQIRSSKDIQIVDFPARFYKVWRETVPLPPSN